MSKKNHSHKFNKGFTLIELLIVIGLLGALTALVLPSLMADREEALGNVCDYNQAGTVRVLKQYYQLTGGYPADMHSGLWENDGSAAAMPGLPEAQADHMGNASGVACPSLHPLSADEAASLVASGITSICYGDGLQSEAVAEGVNVVRAADGTNYWLDDSDPAQEMTFDGVKISDYCAAATSPDKKDGVVIALWITPTTNWDSTQSSLNQDWGGNNVRFSIDMEGQCPIPQAAAVDTDEVTFAYYMTYFKVYSDGTKAKLIGSTCPECGVLNP